MGMIQFRFGPNKVYYLGIIQFIADLLKLIFKEQNYLFFLKRKAKSLLVLVFIIRIIFWNLISFNYLIYSSQNYFLVLIAIILIKIIALRLFFLVQKSVYVQIRFVRIIVQFISYDIIIISVIVFFVILLCNFSLFSVIQAQKYLPFIILNIYVFIIWTIRLLMEVLRLPFDFYESESELISGFNLELGSVMFTILFMVEYLDIIYFINLTVILFIYIRWFFPIVWLLLITILWIRTITVRYRYDKILKLIWQVLLFMLISLIIILLSIVYS